MRNRQVGLQLPPRMCLAVRIAQHELEAWTPPYDRAGSGSFYRVTEPRRTGARQILPRNVRQRAIDGRRDHLRQRRLQELGHHLGQPLGTMHQADMPSAWQHGQSRWRRTNEIACHTTAE